MFVEVLVQTVIQRGLLLVSIGRLNKLNKTSHDASNKHFVQVILETLWPACLLIVHMLV